MRILTMLSFFLALASGFPVFAVESGDIAAPQLESDYTVQPVQFPAVELTDSFWAPRQKINHLQSIPYAFDKCETTGRVSNFWLAANIAPKNTKYVPPIFNDSDIYKGIEAASFDLAINPNPEMEKYLDRLICIIGAAQEEDGYIYTDISRARDFSQVNPTSVGKRWHNIQWSHETYVAGHMYEAASAHYIATGKRNFLNIACKSADLMCKTFGPDSGQVVDVPGHEVIEMGLVKLYRITGEKRYLNLAKFFVEMRGRADKRNSLNPNPKAMYGDYAQDARPLVEEQEAVGHAVRAVYYYAGAADVAAITKDQEIVKAINRIWDNVVGKKIYITGGLGGTPAGEAFAANYVLNNFNGYSETCAQIGGCGWHQRMFLLSPDTKYYDVIEQTIYNGLISGVSLSGDKFFYPNQLATRTGMQRAEWFGCACCPQNLMRFVASIGGYIYAVDKENLYVGLYIANKSKVRINNNPVALEISGNYPWSEDVAITVNPEQKEQSFTLNLRMPGWLNKSPMAEQLYTYTDGKTYQATVKVNGKDVEMKTENGFLKINRNWTAGDKIEIHFPLVPRWVTAKEQVKADRGCVALMRGPIVYTFEGCDNNNHIFDSFVNSADPVTVLPYNKDLLGGIVPLEVKGTLNGFSESAGVSQTPETLRAIPYCVWTNRAVCPMQVWMPNGIQGTDKPSKTTIANQSKITVSFNRGDNGQMNIRSICDGEYPDNNEDLESDSNFDFWPHLGTAEWIQYDFKKPVEIQKITLRWFNDSKRSGACKDPKSWKLLIQNQSGEWGEPTSISGYPCNSDKPQSVTFDKITAKAIKLEIQLQPNASAGLYEWDVE